MHDRQTGTTTLVTVNGTGGISADGRFVSFGDSSQVFVHDRDTDGDGIFDEPGFVSDTW